MRARLPQVVGLTLALANAGAVVAPRMARALTPTPYCSSTHAPSTYACAEWVCVEADRVWELRALPFGSRCGSGGFCNGASYSCTQPEEGYVTPRYMVVAVRYVPPGQGSSVTYSTSKSVGTATSVSSSFTRSNGVEVSVGYNVGWSAGTDGVSVNDTLTTGSTDSVSVVHTVSSSDTLPCFLPYCGDYIDHRNDEITLLIRPKVRYSAFRSGVTLPSGYKQVTWGLDVSQAIVKSPLVGHLNGTMPWPIGKKEELAYYGIGCAPDAGLECTADEEYAKILSATAYGHASAGPVLVPGSSAFAFPWEGNWFPDPDRYEYHSNVEFAPPPPVKTVSRSIEDSWSSSSQYSSSRSYSVEAEVSVGFGIMKDLLGASVTGRSSWTWTNSTSRSQSQEMTDAKSVTFSMPGNDYSGPQQIAIYFDRLYQTFMFSYCADPILPRGCASGPPLPDVPARLEGAASATHSSVALSWLPVIGATGYGVWRSTSPSGGFAPIATAVNGFAFADDTATTPSTPYYYYVTASNRTGSSAASALAVVPPAPTGLTWSRSGNDVYVSWAAAAEATSYTLWRRVDTTGTFAALASCTRVATRQCVDTEPPPAGTRHFYAVTASSPTGSSSRSSQIEVLSPPPAPTGVAASGNVQAVYVSWTAAPLATSYNVLRSTNNLTWYPAAAGVATTYLYDSGLTAGATYLYKVQAVNAGGAGPYSSVVSATAAYPPQPEPDPYPDICPPPPARCL